MNELYPVHVYYETENLEWNSQPVI